MLAVASGDWASLEEAGASSAAPQHGAAAGSLQLAAPCAVEGFGAAAPRRSAMRKCVSTPTLHSLCCPESEGGLEVYVVMRSFTEFGGGLFRKLPRPVRRGVRDAGLCHYMTVFKKPDGSLVQFDFGPKGGDIHVARGPLARLLAKQPAVAAGGGRSKAAVGEVRENQLKALPTAHMYVGRTNMSIDEIRAWSSSHRREYELHINDCRHYVNSLVKYTTGMESAASSMLRHQWVSNRQQYGLANRLVRLGQIITDLSNWQRVKAVSQASMAAVVALATHGTLSKLTAAPLLQSVRQSLAPAARRSLVPVRQGMVKAVVQKPVYAVGTAAVATCAAAGGPAPALRETVSVGSRIAGGVKTAVRAATLAAATVAETVGKRTALATRRTTDQAVAIVVGVAAATTRGATGAMLVPPRPPAPGALLAAAPAAVGGGLGRGTGSPTRATLPCFTAERAQRLALVATRR